MLLNEGSLFYKGPKNAELKLPGDVDRSQFTGFPQFLNITPK